MLRIARAEDEQVLLERSGVLRFELADATTRVFLPSYGDGPWNCAVLVRR